MSGEWGEASVAEEPKAFRYRYGATVFPTIFIRAPNRYRKLLVNSDIPKPDRDEFGLDFFMLEKSPIAIEMQRAEFPAICAEPIGFQALLDNDIAIAWEPSS